MRLKRIKPITPRHGLTSREAAADKTEKDQSLSEVDDAPAMQAALLNHVLDEHPTLLRQCDLVRELFRNPSDFDERDAVDRAIEALVKVGLLDRNGKYVLPTPSALHFHSLPRL